VSQIKHLMMTQTTVLPPASCAETSSRFIEHGDKFRSVWSVMASGVEITVLAPYAAKM
jgi:hypothetical protein